MEEFDFSQPSRQSSKGIIVIFAVNAVKWLRALFPALVALGFGLFRKNSFLTWSPWMIALIIFVLLLLMLGVAVLKYLNFKFHVADDDFHLDTGIIEKDKTIIPKSKIQNVYIQQNFLQQIINVVSLKVESAGDKKSEIEINALSRPMALQLKKALFDRKSATVETNDIFQDEVEANVFFKISIKRLFLEGLLHNHLKSFAIITSFAFGIYYEFKSIIEDLQINDNLDQLTTYEDGLAQVLYLNLLLGFIVLIISIVYSVVRIVIGNFNLEVIENNKTIEISKGLLNKVSLTLTPDKIQNVIVKTNALKRRLNLHSLYVKQAMTNEKQSKNFGIIALEDVHIQHLLDKLLQNYHTSDEKRKPSSYYKRIMAFYSLLFLVLINLIAVVLFDYNALFVNLFLVPFMALSVHYRYKKAYYNITEPFLTVGSGFIDTKKEIINIHKLQAVKLVQNIFQKRRGVASVIVYTASKSVTIPYVNEKQAKSIYDFLLFKVESEGKNWM
ncbi:PH domain-containing protein [Subsaxibacter sp. CAU 1640]|uniref:PH domain-containing protein n=1 Tax=Subsaxibacter sp. CAU 1640 TaxID=2933271 RepID=UPI0020053690|nr:PH domain-containing protein [Subsaxibacter sp. CAU 1640]MCK7590921.1 PH domain-containing protein [Subsaxibacter sp. CAU 1640]